MHSERQSLREGVSTKARRKIPRAPFKSRSIFKPSLPLITFRPPRLGIISPVHETVLLVYASLYLLQCICVQS